MRTFVMDRPTDRLTDDAGFSAGFEELEAGLKSGRCTVEQQRRRKKLWPNFYFYGKRNILFKQLKEKFGKDQLTQTNVPYVSA